MAKRLRGQGSRQRWKAKRLQAYRYSRMNAVVYTPPIVPPPAAQETKIVDYYPTVTIPEREEKKEDIGTIDPVVPLTECEIKTLAVLTDTQKLDEFKKRVEAAKISSVILQ